jgi:hypothetical protein
MDDLDKLPPFCAGANPRRSTSSLDPIMAPFRVFGRPNWKARFALLASIAITYLGSYLLLSLSGHYRDNVSVVDDFGPPCLCVSSWEQWQPALIKAAYLPGYARDTPILITNGLGYLYLPLVHFDQEYFHPSRHILAGNQ